MPSRASSEANAGRERPLLGLDPGVEVAGGRHALDLLDRERRLAGELPGPREGRVEQLVVGDDASDQPQLVGLAGVDRIAHEIKLQRARLPDQPRQPLGAAEPGNDPEADLGLTEARRLGRDPEVACHRQLAPAAERDGVHSGDRDDAAVLHRAQQPVHLIGERRPRGLVHGRERLDVGAGAEQHRIGGGEHERADRARAGDGVPHLGERPDHLRGN